MKPPRNEDEGSRYHKPKPAIVPERIKVRQYRLTFKDDPKKLEHLITISEKDGFYTIDVNFSKPLLDKRMKFEFFRKGESISGRNLKELKESTFSSIRSFGEYEITPL